MNILDFVDDSLKEADAFESHPVKALPLDEQLLYLNGLALVINADGDINESEKEYLRILIKSFAMDESTLDSFVEFSQAPDKDVFQAFIKTFRRKPLAQVYLFDAYMLAGRDDKVCEKERLLIEKIARGLEILKGTLQDIFDLFCHIKHRNWQESALYFSSHLLNPQHFKHLLDYYDVNFDTLMEETKYIRQSRLQQVLERKLGLSELTWINNADGIKVTKDYIPPLITLFDHSILIPWLQSRIESGEIDVINGKIVKKPDNTDELSLCSLTDAGLIWDAESRGVLSDDLTKFNHSLIDTFIKDCHLDNEVTGLWLFDDLNKLKIGLSEAKLNDEDGETDTFLKSTKRDFFPMCFADNDLQVFHPKENAYFPVRVAEGKTDQFVDVKSASPFLVLPFNSKCFELNKKKYLESIKCTLLYNPKIKLVHS